MLSYNIYAQLLPLGVASPQGTIPSDADLSTYVTPGVWRIDNAGTLVSSSAYNWGMLIILSTSGSGVSQIFLPNSSSNTKVLFRNRLSGTSTFTSWTQISAPSYLIENPTLSSLASALGGFGLANMTTYRAYTGDMNDIKENAWGYVSTTTTNAPSGITEFSFLSFCAWTSAPIQIVVGQGGFAMRRYLFNAWSPWKIVK